MEIKESIELPKISLEKIQAAKDGDSLKFAGIKNEFKLIGKIPSKDTVETYDTTQYSSQISDMYSSLKALQIAKKSLSDTQSIVKDIKSNYKTEKNDAWAPIDDTMLQQRYNAVQQIKDVLANAKYNHKNVFIMDYSKYGVTLNLERKDLNSLNLRDEHSINIFSDNINKLSQQIEDGIRGIQDKIDKIEQGRWLSMEKLSNVKITAKDVNSTLKASNETPTLATLLAQVAQPQESSATNANEIITNNVGVSKKAQNDSVDNDSKFAISGQEQIEAQEVSGDTKDISPSSLESKDDKVKISKSNTDTKDVKEVKDVKEEAQVSDESNKQATKDDKLAQNTKENEAKVMDKTGKLSEVKDTKKADNQSQTTPSEDINKQDTDKDNKQNISSTTNSNTSSDIAMETQNVKSDADTNQQELIITQSDNNQVTDNKESKDTKDESNEDDKQSKNEAKKDNKEDKVDSENKA